MSFSMSTKMVIYHALNSKKFFIATCESAFKNSSTPESSRTMSPAPFHPSQRYSTFFLTLMFNLFRKFRKLWTATRRRATLKSTDDFTKFCKCDSTKSGLKIFSKTSNQLREEWPNSTSNWWMNSQTSPPKFTKITELSKIPCKRRTFLSELKKNMQ